MTAAVADEVAAVAAIPKRPDSSTPARFSTPPPPTSERGRLEMTTRHHLDSSNARNLRNTRQASDASRPVLDPEAVDSALLREMHRPHRESTPGASPSRKRQRINGDRYVKDVCDQLLPAPKCCATDTEPRPDSSHPGPDRTCKQASVCSMRMDRRRRRRGKRNALHTANFTFRRVRLHCLPYKVVHD